MNEIMTKGEELGLWVEDILSLAFNKGSLGKGREESLVGKDSQPSPHSPTPGLEAPPSYPQAGHRGK